MKIGILGSTDVAKALANGFLAEAHEVRLSSREPGTPMTGWELFDNNPATKKIVAGGGNLYQMHQNGLIWKLTGPPMEFVSKLLAIVFYILILFKIFSILKKENKNLLLHASFIFPLAHKPYILFKFIVVHIKDHCAFTFSRPFTVNLLNP